MELVVTQEILDAAKKLGACSEGVSYKPGTPIHQVKAGHLAWLEEKFPELAADIARLASARSAAVVRGVASLALFGYGDGSGSGYGSGYGDGDGDGYGSGYGDGDGSGDGSGYGYGYGYGAARA